MRELLLCILTENDTKSVKFELMILNIKVFKETSIRNHFVKIKLIVMDFNNLNLNRRHFRKVIREMNRDLQCLR